MEERLQKILSRAGLGSRRACEAMIAQGRVAVDGHIASLGDQADPQTARITVDGKPLKAAEAPVYIALHKPRGVISAAESPDRRQTARDLVPIPGRLYPVGRLDADSEGLILLTNDGELANQLTHPRYGHEKVYRVLVASWPDDEQLEAWRRGVVLEDGYRTQPAEVRVEAPFGKGAWLRVVLKEGRKRQIREVGARLGLTVVRIIRVRIGALQLGNLKPREWRRLSEAEVAALKGKPEKDRARPERSGARSKKTEARLTKTGPRSEQAGSRPARPNTRIKREDSPRPPSARVKRPKR